MYVRRVMEVGRGVKGLRRTGEDEREGMETNIRRAGCSNKKAGGEGEEMEKERWRKIHM
jgi:hypothetical protein